jgi:hypothetical protein
VTTLDRGDPVNSGREKQGSTRVLVHAVAREGTVIKGGEPKKKGTRWIEPERRHGSTGVPGYAFLA